MIQQTMFDDRAMTIPPPYVPDSDTSHEAAEKIKPHVSRMHAEILDVLRSRADHGATDEEIREALGLRADTARARRCELRDLGRIRDSGHRRPTSSGRAAVVWVLMGDGR